MSQRSNGWGPFEWFVVVMLLFIMVVAPGLSMAFGDWRVHP